MRVFDGDSGQWSHLMNFAEAIEKRDPSILNAEVAIGNSSSGWCNLANIGFFAGAPYRKEDALKAPDTRGLWPDVIERLSEVVESYGIDMEKEFRLSPYLAFDQEAERFTGEGSELANSFLKREYRAGFVFPEEV